MGDKSKIEWTDATWNPVRGCALVSAGCTNCYAMRVAHRFSGDEQPYAGLTKLTSHGPVWTGDVTLWPDLLDVPLRWRRPRRIFVNSMSDLFHGGVPEEFIDGVFATMAAAPHHTFQILTKRPDRMVSYLSRRSGTSPAIMCRKVRDHRSKKNHVFEILGRPPQWPLPNVWLGVSAEDQNTFDERWSYLNDERLAGWVLFLSAEPLLGPIDISQGLTHKLCNALSGDRGGELSWVIAGGESGPRARQSHPDWFRSLRDQCKVADVPFFFKQWGEWCLIGREGPGVEWLRVGKKLAGNVLDGRTHLEYPG